MMKNAVALLRNYLAWVRQLPRASEFMFAARTSSGRLIKIFLFAVGAILPLGSLLWILLFWHGKSVSRATATTDQALRSCHLTAIPASAGDS